VANSKSELGSPDNPFTHEVDPRISRKNKHCQCQFCGHIGVCSGSSDYYSGRIIAGKQPLACKGCMLQGKVSTSVY
jgi:hypothetical protein